MAEFQEVMRQKKRMCDSHKNCDRCPIFESPDKKREHLLCSNFMHAYPDIAEKLIMKWAAEHPEPKYPTWIEWWNENFEGEGQRMLQPCAFVSPKELGCSIGHDGCMQAPYKCWHTPIPAHIAEKLGIQPIEEE